MRLCGLQLTYAVSDGVAGIPLLAPGSQDVPSNLALEAMGPGRTATGEWMSYALEHPAQFAGDVSIPPHA